MKKQLIKTVTPLLTLLIIISLAAFPVPVTAQNTTSAQEKTMHFMETMLPIDLSKYTIKLQNENTMDGTPALSDIVPAINRKITSLTYQLTSEESVLHINFLVEKDKIVLCTIDTITGEAIYSNQYLSQFDAVKDFLERYQTYTKIDSSNLITMLYGADLTKNSTITTENNKLSIDNIYMSGRHQTLFYWTYTINDVAYTSLELIFENDKFMTMTDTRVVFTIGDTSINISYAQAIEIALEKLQSYSYGMPDGSVVKDFKVSDYAAMLYTVPLDYVNYELRPYWDVRLFLEEGAPGSVFGITVFIWANTGEIISTSNMASGGINYPDNYNSTDTTSPAQNQNKLIIGIAIITMIVAVTTASILMIKKRRVLTK
jgi:hypothetical protein